MLAAIELDSLIVAPVSEMLTKLIGYLPTLIGALIILTLGWVFAKALRRVVNRALEAIHFGKLAEKAGISEILNKGGLKISANDVLSGLVYWLAIIMVLVIVVNALGLPQASNVLESLFAFIPSVISALFVLVVGMFLANFVSGIVRTAAGNASLPRPEMFSSASRWAIIIFADYIQYNPWRCLPCIGPGFRPWRKRCGGEIPRGMAAKTQRGEITQQGRGLQLNFYQVEIA